MYTQLNAEFQRIARRDKKALISDQCKKIDENKRMGKARDLFKKIYIKGIFHARIGTIKDRHDKNITEADEIKNRGQEYTELYKKDLNDPDNQDSVVTHLEQDILECEVKWALGSITTTKLVEMMEFQLSYFRSQKMMLLKCALTISANLENSAVAIGLEKVSFPSNPKEEQSQIMFKVLDNCAHFTC